MTAKVHWFAATAINLCDLKAQIGDARTQEKPMKLLPVKTIFHLKHFN